MLAEGFTSGTGAVLLVAGAIVLVISLGRLMRNRWRGPGDSDGTADAEAARRLREAANREIARIDEYVRGARAEVETRTHVLNGLLLRAEKVIARLEGAGGETDAREPKPPDSRFAEVYRLADDGASPAAIADRTEFERGEVELILGLRVKASSEGPKTPEDAS